VPAELSMTEDHDARLREQAQRVPPAVVTHLLDLLAVGLRAMKDGADARTQLELALVKAADPARDPSVKALLARLERLERGTPAAPPAPVHAPDVPATAAGRARSPASMTVDTAAGPAAIAAVSAKARDGDDEQQVVVAAVEIPSAAPEPEPATAVSAAVPDGGDEPIVAVAAVGIAPADGELDADALRELWPAVLEQLTGGPLGAFLAEAMPVGLDGETLTVAFSESAAVFLRQADRPANRETVAAAVRAVTGRAVRLAYELRADDDFDLDDGLEPVSEEELIARFIDEFDARELHDDGETQ
jgi:DNA polymerase-3 subunit gamma/tau